MNDILEDVNYKYPAGDNYFAYTTRGCPNHCSFCAVPILEPNFHVTNNIVEQIKVIDQKYGPKQHLLLLDNNVLNTPNLESLVDDLCAAGFGRGAKYVDPGTYNIVMMRYHNGDRAEFLDKKMIAYLDKFKKRIKSPEKLDTFLQIVIGAEDAEDYAGYMLEHEDELSPIVEKYRSKTPKARYLDFNQGVDGRKINDDKMLYEQYNDALFRLLMHSVAQHQGQQYQEENQALKAQEGGPSETAKRRCLRTISRQVRRGHARAAARTASRVLSKAAVVMLLVISCLTAAFAVSPVFRSDALRWAVATFGDHAEYRFNQTEGGVQYQGIEVGWLPEGYELVESDVTNRTISQFYTRSSGGTEQSIEIQVMDFAGEGIFKVDTEADELYQVIVQNTLATVIERGSRIQITWMHPKFNCIVMLYSDNISAETALRIAQSIVLS